MIKDELSALLQAKAKSVFGDATSACYFGESLKSKKFNKAIKSANKKFIQFNPSDVLLFYDFTIMHTGDCGLIFTDKAIYVRGYLGQTNTKILLSDITGVTVKKTAESNSKEERVFLSSKNGRRVWLDIVGPDNKKLCDFLRQFLEVYRKAEKHGSKENNGNESKEYHLSTKHEKIKLLNYYYPHLFRSYKQDDRRICWHVMIDNVSINTVDAINKKYNCNIKATDVIAVAICDLSEIMKDIGIILTCSEIFVFSEATIKRILLDEIEYIHFTDHKYLAISKYKQYSKCFTDDFIFFLPIYDSSILMSFLIDWIDIDRKNNSLKSCYGLYYSKPNELTNDEREEYIAKDLSILNWEIQSIELGKKIEKILNNEGIFYLGQLICYKTSDLMAIPSFTEQMVVKIATTLDKYKLKLADGYANDYTTTKDFLKLNYKNEYKKYQLKKGAKATGEVVSVIALFAAAMMGADMAASGRSLSQEKQALADKVIKPTDMFLNFTDNVDQIKVKAVSRTISSMDGIVNRIVDYQKGKSDNDIAFMFSCPGQKEMQNGAPCQGTTGENLNIVIEKLHNLAPNTFKYTNKEDYMITNASNKVHFQSLTNDTEASTAELLDPENIKRLKNELKGKKMVICCGDKANEVIKEVNPKIKVINCEDHFGSQKLNRKYPNSMFSPELTANQRREARLDIVANSIFSQI